MFELHKPLPDKEFEVLTKIETRYNYVLEYFPMFYYWAPNPKYADRCTFKHPNNIVGYQQRAFESYWCIRGFIESGGTPGLSLCTGQAPGLFSITNDFYYGENHPEYGGAYHPQIVHTAEKLSFLGSNTFPIITCLHGLEHLKDTVATLREWIRIAQPDGIIAIVMPNEKHTGIGGGTDIEHKSCYNDEIFKTNVLSEVQDQVYIEEFDSFKNDFSYNVVLRKKWY